MVFLQRIEEQDLNRELSLTVQDFLFCFERLNATGWAFGVISHMAAKQYFLGARTQPQTRGLINFNSSLGE